MALDWTTDTTQALLDHGSTTVQTVLDIDGKLKNALHNKALSTDLSDTDYWNLDGVGTPVVSGVSPSGKVAYLLTEDTSTGLHGIYDSFDFTAGDYYGFPFDFKANGSRTFSVQLPSGAFGASVQWTFDPVALTATQDTSGTKDAGTIKSLGDDWYRAVVYAEATSTTGGSCYFMGNNGSTPSYTGDGSSGLYLSRHRILKASVHAPAERVTNGDFAGASTAGWTGNNATLDATGDELTVTDSTGAGFAYTSITTEASSLYRVEYTTIDAREVYVEIRDGAYGGTQVAYSTDWTGSRTGTFVFFFTALSALSFLRISDGSGSSFDVTIDNVSVTKVITDGVQLDDDGEDFMETSGAAVYSDGVAYDGNGACLGLQCFSGSTNLNVDSNDFDQWLDTGNIGTLEKDSLGIDGDVSATTLVDSGATGTGQVHIGFTANVDPSSEYTWTVVAEAGQLDWIELYTLQFTTPGNGGTYFDLRNATIGSTSAGHTAEVEDLGGGRVACTIKFTTDASDTVGTLRVRLADGDADSTVDLDGSSSAILHTSDFQKGSCKRPYTPTNGSAVARSANGASKAVSTFGYRQDQGTVTVEFQSAGTDGSSYPSVFQFDDGTGSNRVAAWLNTGNTLTQAVNNDGATEVNSGLGAYTPDAMSKVAVSYKKDDFAGSLDGAAVVADSSGEMPPVTTLRLGHQNGAAQNLEGYIKRIIYEPIRAANDTLVSEAS
ncbi:MAG: hypothetical protein Unbinned5081contig1001_62 [Prokaryotic dsDNA virus sp.]|nr:MAG: hypothetical protein Unbinned5081contig1001_62 [Prokaryotic dsDNA virus sp.]|tara:strand:+ start:5794 stop:7950 length:2157 start_codon:yes stop_codon:yes gene_type:complete